MNDLFDGPLAGLTASIMARMNRDAEAEAVELLAPAEDAAVLVLGFGPGLGVRRLAERLPRGRVLGLDPSAAMVAAATRANRAAIASGRVMLTRARADRTPCGDGAFDGAIAVNTLQLCEPLDATARELARVLKPGARLVSLTHAWALERHTGSVEGWIGRAVAAFEAAGFGEARSFRGRAEKGQIVAFVATRQAAA